MASVPRHRVGLLTLLTGALALTACTTEDPRRAPSTPAPDGQMETARTVDGGTRSGDLGGEGPGSTDGDGPGSADDDGPGSANDPETATVRTVAVGFHVPWGLVPLDDGSLLVGERDTADVYRVVPGADPTFVTTVPGVVPDGEGGLLGLAVPEGSAWHTGTSDAFYAYATTENDNRVLRVEPTGGSGEPSVEVTLDGIPKAGNHNGGRIAFGPDDLLYVTTGDASDGASAQDPQSLAGKVLRVTPGGAPAPDNPDPGSPVWSLGHRNVQGLDWDGTGQLWASEFGQNALDEVNLIVPGGNYGWPEVEGPGGEPEFIDPVVSWPTADASPSGLAVGSDGALYVAALRGESLWRVPVEERGPDPGSATVGEPERLLEGEFGRLRSVVTGPAGELWVLTSNTFRGAPAPGDDQLLLIEDPSGLG